MPLPIWGLLVGVIVGFMASPNPAVAMIFGGMLALVMWAIQGFPVESDGSKNIDLDQSQADISAQAMSSNTNKNASELSNLSPIDVGRSLAISIGYSCNMDDITEEEISLINNCNSSIEQYDKERVVLGAFAQDYAIVSIFGGSEIGNQVREGFLEVWNNIAKHDEKNNALFRLFIDRCSVYVGIVEKVLQPETINPLGGEFAKCLGIDYSNGSAIILGEKYVVPVFFGHYVGAIKIFEQAGLLNGN